jgi:hypothetical protein
MLTQPELDLASDLGELSADPYRAVLYGFPWGSGDLAESAGPRKWQREVLEYIGEHLSNPATCYQPCRIAISSGHDIGKSAFIAMVSWWAMSTFDLCRCNISANTDNQLKTKTSPELAKWFRQAVNTAWFDKTVTSVKVADPKFSEEWRTDLIPWSEENPAAFAGLHNKGKRLLFVIDEASEVPQIIFDTMEGVLLDENTQIIVLISGNPTRNKGPFYDIVFGKRRHRWKTWTIDSRQVEGTNKAQLAQWEQDYGEDSDFFRVRARGLPPVAESAQFIDQDLIDQAQKRRVVVLPDEPLVAGVDFAWGGADDNVIRFRCGLDAASIKPIKIKGEFTRDPAVLTGKLADVLTNVYNGRKIAMLFLDSAGIAAPVESRLRQLGHRNIVTVNFGAHSPDTKCAYMRDYMWQRMKEWLRDGSIDEDSGLAADLAGPCLVSDKQQRIKLEDKELMKKRGLDSPDDADALALTFAQTVAAPRPEPKPEYREYYEGAMDQSWMMT